VQRVGMALYVTKYFVDSLRGVQEENLVMLGENLLFLFFFLFINTVGFCGCTK